MSYVGKKLVIKPGFWIFFAINSFVLPAYERYKSNSKYIRSHWKQITMQYNKRLFIIRTVIINLDFKRPEFRPSSN